MNVRWVWSALAVAGFVVGVASVPTAGCGSSDCRIGSESCSCTSGGACDPGLTCASMKCVRLAGGTGGATGGGGSGGGAAGAGGSPPAAGFDAGKACDDFSKTLCEKLNGCASAFLKIIYGDVATCTDRLKVSCLDGAMAMDTGLNQAAVDTCLTAAKAASCTDIIYRQVAACDWKGKRANGQICGTGEQCTSGYCKTNDSACGTCGDHVGAGATCKVDDDCQPGFVCSADTHCVKPGEGGSVCTATQPCKLGFYCRGTSCVEQAQSAGLDCQDAEGCSLLQGLVCNTRVGKCQTLLFAGAGNVCGFMGNTVTACTAGSNCQNNGQLTGVCGATAKDGASCSATVPCLPPARCINGNCRLPNSRSCN